MTMEPTLGEVSRTLKSLAESIDRRFEELSARLDRLVTLDVYDAHRAATADRIATTVDKIKELQMALDKERAERRADRRVIIGSALTAVLSLLITIISAVVIAALGLK